MSDSPNTFYSPYPGILSQQGDQHGLLTSHAAASVERNQDAQFSAIRTQAVHRDVEASKLVTAEAAFRTERGDRQAERESARQFAELKSELATMRAEGLAREVQALRDSAQTKALADILTAVKALVK